MIKGYPQGGKFSETNRFTTFDLCIYWFPVSPRVGVLGNLTNGTILKRVTNNLKHVTFRVDMSFVTKILKTKLSKCLLQNETNADC